MYCKDIAQTAVEHFLDHVASKMSLLDKNIPWSCEPWTFTLCKKRDAENDPQENCKYVLHIPRRIFIGEITHGREGGGEKMYKDQENLPTLEEFQNEFRDFFTQYAQYDAQGNVLAHVTFEPAEGDEKEEPPAAAAIVGTVTIQYGPLYPFPSQPTYKSSLESLLMRYTETLRRQNQIESELFGLRELLESERQEYVQQSEQLRSHVQRAETQHAYLQQQVRRWFADYDIREECVVCWLPLIADDVVFPACGHLICNTCHEQCHQQQNRCPVCRYVYEGINGEPPS